MKAKIVTICGSMRHKQYFSKIEFHEIIAGNVVLSITVINLTKPDPEGKLSIVNVIAFKHLLDIQHLRKIRLSDEIYVINVEGYVGLSTAREIAYAYKLGKTIRWYNIPSAEESAVQIYLKYKDNPQFLELVAEAEKE